MTRPVGPDAARYLAAGAGHPVPRPFNTRWLLPTLCRDDRRRWTAVYGLSWPLCGVGMVGWAYTTGQPVSVALAAAALLLALPGILGPPVSIPVQVDLPATAVAVVAAWCIAADVPILAAVLLAVGVSISEKAPVVAALLVWSPYPLLVLIVPVIVDRLRRPGPDPLGSAKLQWIADHPIRSALEAHRGQWRNAWVMVAPWGVCLVALYDPTWPVVVALLVAYGQLLVATDTVRLLHHVAGPVVAVAAAERIPTNWLLLAVVVHAVWWWQTERV